MTTNYIEAGDTIRDIFNKAWKSQAPAVVGDVPKVIWQGKNERQKPPKEKSFCRFSTWTDSERQATLGCNVGEAETWRNRYRTEGYLLVQVFVPVNELNAEMKARQLAIIARNAFRHINCAVKFKNGRIREIAYEGDFCRCNAIVDFTYDELG